MMNKVILMGRLVADPEVRKTQSGVSVARFRLAVNRRFAKPEDEVKADFIECAAWRNTADFVGKYFVKGQMCAVVGEIRTRKWQGEDGNMRYATEVLVDEMHFAGGKKEAATASKQDEFTEVDEEEDLPF